MSRRTDIFGFDELPPPTVPEDVQAADDRTLRLSAPVLSAEDIQRFLRYQRTLRDHLSAAPLHADRWHAHLSDAHTRALEASGLEPHRHGPIQALAAQFASRRATVGKLREKQEALRRKMAEMEARGEDPTEDDRKLDQKLTTELARLDSLLPLERRYGAEAIAALRPFEQELVELHLALVPLVARS